MSNTEQKVTKEIPAWFKIIACLLFISVSGLLGVAVFMPARSYFGLNHQVVVLGLTAGFFLFGILALILVFFQKSALAILFYWMFYQLRWVVIIFIVYGLTEYILRLPVFYFVYLDPVWNVKSLFSIRGLAPLFGLGILTWGVVYAKPIQNPLAPSQQEKISAFLKRISRSANSVNGEWVRLLVAVLPAAIVCAVIYIVWGTKLSNYLPIAWNDATSYWLWVRQFSFHGFGGGYNYPNELLPSGAFNRFGEGSPFYLYLYGMIGMLVGWTPSLPILINLVLITVALYAFSRSLNFDTGQNAILGLVLLVSWPILLYLATTSHETLNQALAIGMAGIFLALLRGGKFTVFQKILLVLYVVFAGLVRLSWVILLFPLLFLCFRGSLLRKALLSGLVGGVLSFGIMSFISYIAPPINNSIFSTVGGSASEGFRVVTLHFLSQFKSMVRLGYMRPSLSSVLIVLFMLGYSVSEVIRKIRQREPADKVWHSQAVFDFYNLATLLVAGMTLYLANGFFRVFFPPMLVSILMQIAQKNYRALKSLVVLSLLFAPASLISSGDLDGAKINYTYQMPNIADSKPELDKWIPFDSSASNPWCNTILIPLKFYDGRLTALNPGIGVSYINPKFPFEHPVLSKYLLLEQSDYETLTTEYNLKAVQLASLSIGDLYRNLDSDCTP